MIYAWAGFITFVLMMLALDLGVFHRTAHVVSVKEALAWSGVWITLGVLFSVFVYFAYEAHWLGIGTAVDAVDGAVNDGASAAEKYLTGYVVEKSLSVDNVFVISLIFSFFAVPLAFQHRVLFWGVLGAIAMRGAMIGVGAKLIHEFHWVLYLFAVFLIVTGLKMLFVKGGEKDPNQNIVIRLTRRFFKVTDEYHGQKFTYNGALTPLALALILVETTDLIFAVDSIPAIFAITADPFLVFTSNIFALMGLRSLYFALAGMVEKFRYLKPALAAILLVVGLKMLFATQLKALLGERFTLVMMLVILATLGIGVLASLRRAPA